MEIFGSKTLDLLDLRSLAGTCTRFRELVHRVLPKELSLSIVGSESTSSSDGSHKNTEYTVQNINVILAAFGSVATAISVTGKRNDEAKMVLDSVARHCGDNLKSLTLRGVPFSENISFGQLKPKFTRLKILHLDELGISPAVRLFDQLKSLVDLRVVCVENGHEILRSTFPNLKRLAYGNPYDGIFRNPNNGERLELLMNFISRHGTMKVLQILIDKHFESYLPIVVRIISSSCHQLEELLLYTGSPMASSSFEPLGQVKSLRILTLCNHRLFETFNENFDMFSGLTQLKELRLYYCQFREYTNQFIGLVQLRKLFITFYMGTISIDIVSMVSNLTSLVELTIEHHSEPCVLTKGSYLRIVEIVKKREQVLTISCSIDFQLREVQESPKIKLRPL